MCLAVPGKILDVGVEHEVRVGRVDFGGIARRVCLEHVPQAVPGDYVLVHVGFALARVDETEAKRIFEYLEQMNELGDVRENA